MKKIILLSAMVLMLVTAGPASAQYILMDVIGEQSVSVGDEITINFYAYAETNDSLSFFALDVGFDDNELDFVSLTYADGFSEMTGFGLAMSYIEDGSDEFAGASLLDTVNGDPGLTGALDLSAGEDQLLFSVVFTATDVETEWTGADIWLEWNAGGTGGGLYWSSGEIGQNIGTSSTDATDLGDDGADFSAVPVPAAVWLLGSGLLGLVGLRRRS
jgi:hypothetical protein